MQDARVLRSKERILKAAVGLVIERGVGGLSVDAVSETSGVAKTTIYRHWKTRDELVFAACGAISTAQAEVDTGSVERDLRTLLRDLARLLRIARWPLVVPGIVDAGERDPEIAAHYAREQRQHGAVFVAAIVRGIERGELPEGTDADLLVAQLTGPLFYRRWFSREPLAPRFVDAIVDGALTACRSRRDSRPRRR